MKDVARATRAALAALSVGATPAEALSAAGAACHDPFLGARYAGGADDLASDSLRPDVVGRLQWSPTVVGLLLARAPLGTLPRVAEACLRARSRTGAAAPRLIVRWVTGYLALAVTLLALGLEVYLGSMAGAEHLELGLALGLASVASVVVAELIISLARHGVSDAQVLRWLIAGELALVPPGAVLGPLVQQVHPLGRRTLERMRQAVRGTTTMRDAIVLWAEDGGLAGPAARLAGLVADGEDAITSTERMARVAALEKPARVDRLMLALANALVVAAMVVIGHAVLLLLPMAGFVP